MVILGLILWGFYVIPTTVVLTVYQFIKKIMSYSLGFFVVYLILIYFSIYKIPSFFIAIFSPIPREYLSNLNWQAVHILNSTEIISDGSKLFIALITISFTLYFFAFNQQRQASYSGQLIF